MYRLRYIDSAAAVYWWARCVLLASRKEWEKGEGRREKGAEAGTKIRVCAVLPPLFQAITADLGVVYVRTEAATPSPLSHHTLFTAQGSSRIRAPPYPIAAM
jgi:hypothetical protein